MTGCAARALNLPPSTFQASNTAVLAVAAVQHALSLDLTYLVTESLYLLTSISQFPQPPATTVLLCSRDLNLLKSHTEVRSYGISFSGFGLLQLLLCPPGAFTLLQMSAFPPFVRLDNTRVRAHPKSPTFLCPFVCRGTPRWLPCLGYRE